jgi:hypothetical protein
MALEPALDPVHGQRLNRRGRPSNATTSVDALRSPRRRGISDENDSARATHLPSRLIERPVTRRYRAR